MIHSIMFMSAISPSHNGSGEGLGLIDRPIMRERTTNFPIIQGTTIKGVLRDEYELGIGEKKVGWLFGPMDDGSKHAGCISFSDASILAFPVRSLKGGFVWATSPLVLYRFQRALEFADLSGRFPKLRALIEKRVLHSAMDKVLLNPDAQNALLVGQQGNHGAGKLILEEFPKNVEPVPELKDFALELGECTFGSEATFKQEFERKLVVLPGDMFDYFVTYATEVVPNIKIDDETGTSKEGLRYSEYLPAETVLYSLISFDKCFARDSSTEFDNETKVQNFFIEQKPEDVVQVGGDETKGKGFVKINFVTEKENG